MAAGAASSRNMVARKSGKSWVQDQRDTAFMDAIQGGIDPEVAQATVKCVTRFATTMCVVIAVVKIAVYFYSKAAVVKTSALDSLGDLVANCITLYTGYRINLPDPEHYPIGQTKFEPIGVLVFSTLMASAMMANAINNIEELLDEEEKSREEAIEIFFQAMFGKKNENDDAPEDEPYGDKESLQANFEPINHEVGKVLKKLKEDKKVPEDIGFMRIFKDDASWNFTTAWDDISENPDEKTLSFVNECADKETVFDEVSKLFFTLGFLGCCALYKLCLWQYCLQIAIPQSASTILVALANDKRNDFVATSFVITCMLVGHFFEEQIGEEYVEKIDPGASLILSSVIVYTWVSLMLPQVSILSTSSVDPEILEPMMNDVHQTVLPNLSAGKVVCYKSSAQNTVEVSLEIPDKTQPYSQIDQVVQNLYSKLNAMEDVERVLIVLPDAPRGPVAAAY